MPLINGVLASGISAHLFAPTPSFDAIATVVANGSTSAYTFSNIPQNYTALQIRCVARSSSATQYDNVGITFNTDTSTSANYYGHQYYGGPSTGALGVGGSGGTSYTTPFYGPVTSAATLPANTYGHGVVDIYDYSLNNKFKSFKCSTGVDGTTGTGVGYYIFRSGIWNNTAAITAVNLYSQNAANWVAGTTFALYGMK